MKILRITPSYMPAIKMGGPIFADFIVDNIIKEQLHDLYILTTKAGIEEQNTLKETKNITYFNYHLGVNFTFSLPLIFASLKKINKCDLVFISGVWNFSSLISPLLCFILKKEFIYVPHGSLYSEKIRKKKTIIKKILLMTFVKFAILRSKKIQVATNEEKKGIQQLVKISDDKFYRFPIPVNVEDQVNYNKIDSEKIKILFVGRINYIKGLDLLLDAYITLKKNNAHIQLHLVGYDDNYLFKLKNKCNFEELDIFYHGGVKNKDLREFYINSDIFIMPSYSENYSIVVAEAAGFGKPILLTDKVGISEFFSDNKSAIIFPPTVDGCINALQKVINNKELRSFLSRESLLIAKQHFSKENSAILVKKLIEE
ncbi:glycosyltransferase family 4 protein [Providencia sp. PROV196]|uniref:glycosyltransferase family 4 protein n=1 Tax=Providencia sp. PROV196 TaxID=2949897 RepID=UPI00234A03AD|nr:glycosyltransferase family 4 protein [Providencia sp. PROV196]